MQLYVARWPDGTAWIVAADSLAEVADVLDETGDPGACEVSPYDGPFAIQMRPLSSPSQSGSLLEFCECDAPDSNYEMQESLLELAFPTLAAVLEKRDDEGRISDADWRAAVAAEEERELKPSEEWSDGVKEWWQAFSGAPADRSAALRDMADVTIPGEPKPETPEQREMFRRAQHEIMQRTADRLGLGGPTKPKPTCKPKKQGKPPKRG